MPESRMVRPVPYRGGGFNPKSNRWVSLLTFVSVLAFWEFSSRVGWVSELFLPAPSSAAMALVELYDSGQLMRHISASMQRLSIGWSLGVGFGIVFGFAAGLFSVARAGVVPLVSAVFPIPKIALLPLFIIWFGIGEESKVATIFFGTFFPTVISTFGGVDSVDRGLIRMGQSFNLNWFSIVIKIILPGALPAILSGMRISGIAMENVSYYAAPTKEMEEIDFINAVINEADCDFLLDVNNIYVNSINHKYDAIEFLKKLPAERVTYLHIAGHYNEADDLLVDTHGADIVDPVWDLLHKTYDIFGVMPTLLERDFNIPPIAELLTEVDTILEIQQKWTKQNASNTKLG